MATINQVTYLTAYLKSLPKRRDLDLSPEAKAQAADRVAAELQALLESGYATPWVPINVPQANAYLTEADELFFGGSAGGGKSWTILGLALTAHTRSLILRREATQLQQLKDDLLPMIGLNDHWRNIGHGGLLDTVEGRKLELNGCASRQDAEKFRGRAHDLKAYDEICLFSEETYRFINAWLRTADPNQRCRSIATGNPPSRPEEEWVIRYWAPWLDSQHPNPAEPGELRWFAAIDGKDVEVENGAPFTHGKELIKPRSRTFIPATLADNPILEATGYRAALQSLPEPLRSQLLYGDMSAGREDDDWQVIPTEWVRMSMRKWSESGKLNDQGAPKRMTCAALDVALGGADSLCLAKRYDNWVDRLHLKAGRELKTGDDIIGTVVPRLESFHMPLVIDVLATAGGTAVTAFRQALPSLAVMACNFGLRTSHFRDHSGKLEMANIRAECYWRLREALDPSLAHKGPRLILPDDPELLSELCAVRWKPVSGKVQCEEKKDIKLRLGRSPDRADAVAMLMLVDDKVGNRWVSEQQRRPGTGDDVIDEMERLEGLRAPTDFIRYKGAKGWMM